MPENQSLQPYKRRVTAAERFFAHSPFAIVTMILYEKLSAFAQRKDVVLRLLQRDNLDTLEAKYWGTAVTNLGRLDVPTAYGQLELDRLIMQPDGGIPLANASLVLGAVTCSGKLSLVVEYAREAVDAASMLQIKDKAMEYLLEE